MPPKKAKEGPSKKNEQKKKDKCVEDKTFGLKNKKGTKNQKFIAQVERQVQLGGDPLRRKADEERNKQKKAKEAAQKAEEEQKLLLNKVVIVQKIEQGVDPKSVFCAFFKQGLCKKGDKCKFSHDPACEGKAAKRNLYADAEDEEDDNMDDWDADKLEEVISKKHGNEKANATDILKMADMVGFGLAQMLQINVNTAMLCLLDTFLKRTKRETTKRIKYQWKN